MNDRLIVNGVDLGYISTKEQRDIKALQDAIQKLVKRVDELENRIKSMPINWS